MRRFAWGVMTVTAVMLLTACQNGQDESGTPETSAVERVELQPSLYERLGGESAIRAVVDDLTDRAAADPKVNFTRQGMPHDWQATPQNLATFKQRMVEFIGQATGGPQVYTGRDMKSAHAGMRISHAEFDALAAHLERSLRAHNVPEREARELMAIVESTRKDIVEVPG